MKSFIYSNLIFIFLCSNLFAQEQTWKIITLSGQPYIDVILSEISNDTLAVKAYGNIYTLKIDSIKYLSRDRKSYVGVGVISGMIIGGFIGNRIANSSNDNNGLFSDLGNDLNNFFGTGFGVLGGGLIGFVVGTGLSADENYNLKEMKYEDKIKILKKLIKKNSR